ncbi:MAG: Rpn family recombination-promoting nuclease/putative transposase [Lentimicrobiaceae bacterium]|jgi:predicted transposase/invertase (TIGR01784 family)|nr:Rpn family recombination-promoting nuclease/putative transposase [Lentimicrobiaceae bacterium]
MARYLDPKNDLTFKRIFGEHPHLLIKFLNAIMPLEQGRVIEEIQYLPAEQVPDVVGKKNSIVDVKCIDNLKKQFIVEMQMYWSEAFNNRMVFNAGKAYARQLNKNEDYDLLKPVYTLAIINDVFDHKTDDFYHHFQIVNKENTDEIIKGLEFVLVELPKFQPHNWKDRKLAVLWLRFLSEVGEDMNTLPKELQEDDDIRQAAELCEQAAFSPEELEKYENYWDAIRIEKTVRNASLREGMAIGLEEGLEKGEAIGLEKGKAMLANEKVKIARNLQSAGIAVDIIANTTGLSIDELNEMFAR